MSLVAQWERIESGLPDGWDDASLALQAGVHTARASALLAPLAPGRAGDELRFHASRRGAGPSPSAVARGLARLDEEGIVGHLRLVEAEAAPAAEPPSERASLAEAWDAAVSALPSDWSDVYAEVALTSTDHLGPAALALAPVNPARHESGAGLRFRCAHQFGYGASPAMTRRCLARLDERGIPGRLTILRALSDTKPVGTQGPVWYLGGKVV